MTMNRFHNKYHRKNHHTESVVFDNDSGRDRIGSEDDPFKGDFYLSGLLSVNGDVSISGDLDMQNNYILNYSATTEKSGIVRIATQTEVVGLSADDCVVTPKALKDLYNDLNEISNPPHTLISVEGVSNAHEDSLLSYGGIVEGQTLEWDGSNWTNREVSGLISFATDAEASEGNSTDSAITAEQLLRECRRNKPVLYTTDGNPSNTIGNGLLELQTNVTVGTLAFQSYQYTGTAGKHGNSSGTYPLIMYRVYRWNGTIWIRVR